MKNKGFTLLEMVAGVFLFVMLVGMVLTAQGQILGHEKKARQYFTEVRDAANQMEAILSASFEAVGSREGAVVANLSETIKQVTVLVDGQIVFETLVVKRE